MGYRALDEKHTFVYFQNGVDNDTASAAASSQQLQNLIKKPVGSIINSSEGIANDVGEYLPNSLHTKDILNEYTYRKLNNKGEPTLIVAHSAGNEDARKALEIGQHYGYHYPNLSFVTVGSPVSQKAMHKAIEQAGAHHLGHIGNWRDPVTYSKTAGMVVLGSMGGGMVYGATVGASAGSIAGPLGAFFLGAAGAGAGAIVGGAGYVGLSAYHPFTSYLKSAELQRLLLNWPVPSVPAELPKVSPSSLR